MDNPVKEIDTSRYGTLMISLHWLMLILIVGAYATIELRGIYPKGSDARALLKEWHYLFGMSVFVLVWLRMVVRFTSPQPEIRPEPPQWQALSASLMHYGLYALMIGLPLLGWLTVSAEGKSISLMGYPLPSLVAEDHAMGKLVEEVHEVIGKLGYFMIGLHAVMALFHHYWLKDNTLLRMLPSGR